MRNSRATEHQRADGNSLRCQRRELLADGIAEVLAILVFASIVLDSPVLRSVLKWGPLGFVGKISYSLYLLHGLALIVVGRYVLPTGILRIADQGPLATWAAFVIYAFVVLAAGAIAYVSFRYIESPFMRIKPE
jgi:peptidoglycan/LPS O-acetylase OafA/YrhL